MLEYEQRKCPPLAQVNYINKSLLILYLTNRVGFDKRVHYQKNYQLHVVFQQSVSPNHANDKVLGKEYIQMVQTLDKYTNIKCPQWLGSYS